MRPGDIWYKLMNSGKQIIRAYGISNGIPCGMDTKISEAHPESWDERIPYANMAEDTEADARCGDRRTKYPGGPYTYNNNHSSEICGKRGNRAAEGPKCQSTTE